MPPWPSSRLSRYGPNCEPTRGAASLIADSSTGHKRNRRPTDVSRHPARCAVTCALLAVRLNLHRLSHKDADRPTSTEPQYEVQVARLSLGGLFLAGEKAAAGQFEAAASSIGAPPLARRQAHSFSRPDQWQAR